MVIEEGGENGVKDGRGMKQDSDRDSDEDLNEDSDGDSDESWPETRPARVTNGAPPYTPPGQGGHYGMHGCLMCRLLPTKARGA